MESATLERGKIEEKDKEIEQAELKHKALKEQDSRIDKKILKIQKFENFLKDFQVKFSDEYPDLTEITTRYNRLAAEHRRLESRHKASAGQTESINN